MADPKSKTGGYESAYGIGTGMEIGSTIAGAFADAQALKDRAKFQTQQLEFNMKLAQLQAEDTIAQGEKDASLMKKKTKQLVGAQRAAISAQGIDVNSGSALDVQNDAEAMGEIDAMTIKLNAARAAWGFKVDAVNSFTQSQMANAASNNAASSTLLTGGIRALAGGAKSYATYSYMNNKNSTESDKKS